MKLNNIIPVAFIICSSSLLAEESTESLIQKLDTLEKEISSLRLAETKTHLREVSKVTMDKRLDLVFHLLGNSRVNMEGKGFDGKDLGVKNLDEEEITKKLKSISEEYAKPRIIISTDKKPIREDYMDFVKICARAGFFSTQPSNSENFPHKD